MKTPQRGRAAARRLLALSLLLAPPALAGPGPDFVVGAAQLREAEAIAAEVSAVTLYPDRAVVVRRGTAAAQPGLRTVRLPDLPATVRPDAFRLDVEGARLLAVKAQRVERADRTVKALGALLDKLDQTELGLSRVEQERAIFAEERTALERAQHEAAAALAAAPEPPPPLKVGDLPPPDPNEGLKRRVAFLDARLKQVDERLAALSAQKLAQAQSLTELKADLERRAAAGLTGAKLEVLAVISSESAEAPTLTLTYEVKGASWSPTYEIVYDPVAESVALKTLARIHQQTGEDWPKAQVTLTTDAPPDRATLPGRPEAPFAPWLVGVGHDPAVRFVAARAEDDAPSPASASGPSAARLAELSARLERALGRPLSAAPTPSASPSDPMEPTLSPRSAPVLEPTGPVPPEYVRTFVAPWTLNLPSSEAPRTVPVQTERFPVTVETTAWTATPAVATEAFLTLTVKPTVADPFLGGPAELFYGRTHTGSVMLPPKAATLPLVLPIGPDPAVTVSRTVKTRSYTEGWIWKDWITEHEVTLEVQSARKAPVRVTLTEPLPQAGEDVEVERRAVSPKPVNDPDDEREVVFLLELPAESAQTASVTLTVGQPTDLRVEER